MQRIKIPGCSAGDTFRFIDPQGYSINYGTILDSINDIPTPLRPNAYYFVRSENQDDFIMVWVNKEGSAYSQYNPVGIVIDAEAARDEAVLAAEQVAADKLAVASDKNATEWFMNQAELFKNQAIAGTPDNVSFSILKGYNLFPFGGKYINPSTGVITNGSANYVVSNYINYTVLLGLTIKSIEKNSYMAIIGFYDVNKNPLGVYSSTNGIQDFTLTQSIVDNYAGCFYVVLNDINYGTIVTINESVLSISSKIANVPKIQNTQIGMLGTDQYSYDLVSGVLEPNLNCFDIGKIGFDSLFFTKITNEFTSIGSAISSQASGTNKILATITQNFDTSKKYSVAILVTPLTSGNVSAYSVAVLGGQILNSSMSVVSKYINGVEYKLYQYNFTPLVSNGTIQFMSTTYNSNLRKIAGIFLCENNSEITLSSQFDSILNNFKYKNWVTPLDINNISKRVLKNVPNVLVVDKSGNSKYNTINSAVSEALNGDTILIMPGEYDEIVNVSAYKYNSGTNTIIEDTAQHKYLHFVGLDRDTTILYNSNGNYNYPPLWITHGSVKNMTIKSINDGVTNYSLLPKRSYCIHVDYFNNTFKNTAKNRLDLENLKLISNHNDCVGCGTGKDGYLLSIRNCDMENTASDMCFKIHNNYSSYANYVELFDNIMKSNTNKCISLNTISPNAFDTIKVKAIRNMAYSVSYGLDAFINSNPTLITLDAMSKLNANTLLNS